MNPPPPTPDNAGLFVIRLQVSSGTDGLHGRLEHVLSGRWHDFDDARGLLAWLRRERRHADAAPPGRPPAPRPDAPAAQRPPPQAAGPDPAPP